MPKVLKGQTSTGIQKSSGLSTEEFLKLNPTFAAKGGPRDYMGLSGDIQEGMDYNISAPIVPTPGSGTYAEDLASSFDTTPQSPEVPKITGTSDAERARLRQEEIEKIKSEMDPGNKPAVYKTSDEFQRLRQEQGVVKDEEELAALQNEANLGNQELRKFRSTAGEAVPEAGRIGMVSEAERNLNFRLEGLALREQSVLSRLNSKNAYISTVVNMGERDYNQALNEYNNEYNKNLKAIDIYNTQMDDQQRDALSGFTTITNLLKDQGVDFNNLDPKLKTQVDSLALKAGLPTGLFEAFASAYPDQKILAPITVKNASGGEDVYFFTQDPKTGQPSLIQTVGLQGAGGVGGGGVGGGGVGGGGGTYTPGADPSVDAWVQLISSGQNKLTDIPGNTTAGGLLRNKVTVALAALGNSSEGKPTTTELGKEALSIAKDLQKKFGEGGSAAVGGTSLFNRIALPGSARTDFIKTFETLKSKLSLEGVKYLKGQGQVSDAERKLLSEAVTNLYLETSEKQFNSALKTIVDKLEGNSGSTYSVVAPDGNTYTFSSQTELDAFKREAGLQ